ncbi:hypothetical protein HYY74_03795 [Candidatus Woesearchaeota archaeon]|nr:hypothetical protein [Candidatus Woesearchaeota archaeon]
MKKLILFTILTAAILASPYAIRIAAGENLLYGDQPYYHARIARQILEGTITLKDALIYNERPHFLGPYHVLLAYASKITGVHAASIVLPLLLGIASFAVFYIIISRAIPDAKKQAMVAVLLVTSPIFIATFSQSSPQGLPILLCLLGYLMLNNRKTTIPGFILLASTIIFGLFNAGLALVLLVSHYTTKNRTKLTYLALLGTAFLASMAYYALFAQRPAAGSLPSTIISDLGGYGFGAFTLLLFTTGIVLSWKKKNYYTLPYYLLLYISAAVFLDIRMLPYLSLPVAIFAGEGLYSISTAKWEMETIKKLTILLIACGLVFSTASYINRLHREGPGNEELQALEWLRQQPDGLVLSHYSNGFVIEYYSQKPVLLNSFLVEYLKNRYLDSEEIFSSRNLQNTERLLNKYDVRYIYIDSAMKSGKVWNKGDEGLLFLFRNKDAFQLAYKTENVEIWVHKTRVPQTQAASS